MKILIFSSYNNIIFLLHKTKVMEMKFYNCLHTIGHTVYNVYRGY